MKLISFTDAVHTLGNNLILCNAIYENDPSILDNCRFDWEDEDGNIRDIYQWYITDCNRYDVNYLEERFHLLFSYSDMLECYILCVDHWGTPWTGVMIEDYSEDC